MIYCRTLGPVSMQLDGGAAPPELLWRKHLALVVYLARSPHRTRSRDHLLGLLWGDRPEPAARHSLNEALRLVRRHVSDAAIRTDGAQVTLAEEAVALDVDQLRDAARAGDSLAASALVTGEFMEGFVVAGSGQFEDWLAAERAEWSQLATDVLTHAAVTHEQNGDMGASAAAAQRAATLSPCSDKAMCALLRALALQGNGAVALQHYEVFTRRMRAELGAAPAAETRTLAERVRRGAVQQHSARPPTEERRVELPLAARTSELESLVAALAHARQSRAASVCVIEGAPGMGRTRLIAELCARARVAGDTVATVHAVPADATTVWSGVAGLARGGLISAPGVVGASPAAMAAIGTICTEWAEHFGKSGNGAVMAGDALVDVLRVSCEEAPMVLMVDDAQWLDGESLSALTRAARDLAALPLTIVLTVLLHADRAALDALRSRIGRDVAGAAVSLVALDPDAIAGFARRLLPEWEEEAVARLSRRVNADSAGNPLFALELLRAITNGLDLGRLRSAWPEKDKTFDQSFPGELPDSVAAAIRVNFRRLSPEAQRLLAAASVLSDRNEETLLTRAADLDQLRARPALDELERQHWLLDDGRGYSFRARLVRDVIARDMLTSGQRRRVLERAAIT